MNMTILDWLILLGLITLITYMAFYTRRYTRSVADFLAANRTAGRYLLCVSDGMAGLGSITIVMIFEMYYQAGFPGAWWDTIRIIIVPAVLTLSGWALYRFRQTRALTLAQFFEMRYSRKFRVFCGVLIWFSGIVNFGIFPAVAARFFMNFLSLPDNIGVYMGIMFFLITFALFFTLMGGQIAVMVTDFIQGIFCNVMFIIIIAVVLLKFDWNDIVFALTNNDSKASMINPFKVTNAENFNIWFYLIVAFTTAYGFLSWQGGQGYNSAAINAHEARMGKSLGVWRQLSQNLFVLILPICAFTFMNHPSFAVQSQGARDILGGMTDTTMRNQASVTVAMKYILPNGLIGGLCAVMLAATIATHDTYMHSWGSIFIQDVILPFRKRPLTQEQHIKWLKISIIGVAAFIFFFSIFFRQSEAIIMFFQITGAIFIGGSGSVIIGGLYWKRGNTAGAWAGMLSGSILAVGGIFLKQIHQYLPFENTILLKVVSFNGAYISFFAAIAAIVMYISVSVLSGKTKYDLDKLLHRGIYAVKEDSTQVSSKPVGKFMSMVGINSDFNTKDKIVYLGMLFGTLSLVLLFLVITIINVISPIPDKFWIGFWKYYIALSFVLAMIATVWFLIGGLSDLKKMFRRLNERVVDEVDDGRVTEKFVEKE